MVLFHHVGSACCHDSRRGRDLDTGQGPACQVSPQRRTPPPLPYANFGKQVNKRSTRVWGTPAFHNSPKLTRCVAGGDGMGRVRGSRRPRQVCASHACCGWCPRPAEDKPRSGHAGAGQFPGGAAPGDGVGGSPPPAARFQGLQGLPTLQCLTALGGLAHGIWAPAGSLACEPPGKVGPGVEDKSSCVINRGPLPRRKYTEGGTPGLNPRVLRTCS